MFDLAKHRLDFYTLSWGIGLPTLLGMKLPDYSLLNRKMSPVSNIANGEVQAVSWGIADRIKD
jgi:hypothetical protein